MSRAWRASLAAGLCTAVIAVVIGPAAEADPRPSVSRAPLGASAPDAAPADPAIPTIAPPSTVDVALRHGASGWAVRARTQVALRADGHRLPDRVSAVVRVRDPRTHHLIDGPVVSAEVGDPGRRLRVDAATGQVDVRIALTARQAEVLADARRNRGAEAAARLVRVRIVQSADVSDAWPGREALATIEGFAQPHPGAVAGPGPQVRTNQSFVTVKNGTANPLTLMSGPMQCIYDSTYAQTEYTGKQSFLGSMNGAVLPAGSSLTVAIRKDDDDDDGYYNDFDYQQVMADYENSVQNGYAWLQLTGINTLPRAGFPYSADNPMGLSYQFWQSIGLFVGHAVLDVASGSGMWATTLLRLQSAYPEFAATFQSLSEAFGPAVDLFNAYFEVVIALAEALYTLVTSSCGANPGYFLMGATDMYHPWRSFAQVYNWNGGNIEVAYDKNAKKSYTAYANGMITQSVAGFTPTPEPPAANALDEVFMPVVNKGWPTFTYLEPPNQAQNPAAISVDAAARTVTCALDPADASSLSANLSQQMTSEDTSQYLLQYPIPIWGDLTTGATSTTQPLSPSYPFDYFVGYNYTAPAVATALATATATVYWSADGQTFTDSVTIPPGQDTVTLPASAQGQAKLVTCVVQAPEMWNTMTQSPLPTRRGLIMGTVVPSDVVQGPDYPAVG